jgi:hypothetical protein
VISVAAAALFWGACFGVGNLKVLFEWLGINRTRLVRVVEAGDEVFAVDEARATYRWDADRRQWQESFMNDDQRAFRQQFLGLAPLPRITGPIYDPAQKRLLAVQRAIPRSPTAIWSGRAGDDWRRQGGADAPERSYGLFITPSGEVVMMGESRVHRLGADPSARPERPKIWGFELPLGGGGAFKPVGPEESLRLDDDASAAMDPQSGAIAIYNEAELIMLETSAGKLAYTVAGRSKLPWDSDQHAVVAFSAGRILVAGVDGRVLLLSGDSPKTEQEFQPRASAPPRFAAASPDGRWFGVVFHDGRLWLYDAEQRQGGFPGISGQGDLTAVAFASEGRMLVADRINRVTAYRLGSLSVERRLSPPLSFTQGIYRWGVLPLYTIFPKPGELSSTSQYLITGKRAEAIDDSDGLEAAHVQLHPWAPVWSGLGFVAVMLALACVYIERQEF